ncbi:MAG: O-antigen ligase family protein [Muribaculaceae bacterium]|nr:O-antigen ligase family protein [Muribaculaceae bacterium]
MKNKKQNIFIPIYYAILVLIMMSRKDAASEPSMVLRLAFMAAVVFPAVLFKNVSYPAVITLFYTLASQGFAYSYMPYTYSIYAWVTLVIVLFFYKVKIENLSNIPKFFIFFTFYILAVDFITSVSNVEANVFQNIFYDFFSIILFLIIIAKDKEKTLTQLPLSFAVITIVLSYLFLANRNEFISETVGGMERSGWVDPNYFGTIIGIGTTISFMKLFSKEWKELNIGLKVVYITAIVISLPTLLLNASRGAMLSVVCAFVFLSMFSKIKLWQKIGIVLIGAVGIIYLYNNQYFDLLLYRIENDSGGGSGRTEIWEAKLRAFSQGNIAQILFGNGYYGGMTITGRYQGFHNDFVGFLVEYGIVGLCLLLYMLYYPIRMFFKRGIIQPDVMVIVFYLVACFITLEPFGLAMLPYYSFYMYALLLSNKN